MSSRQSHRATSTKSISTSGTTPGSQMQQSEGSHKFCSIDVDNQSSLSESRPRKIPNATTGRPGMMPYPISQSAPDLGARPAAPQYAPSCLSPKSHRPLLSGHSSCDSVLSDASDVFDVLQPNFSAGTPDSTYSNEEDSFLGLPGSYKRSPQITNNKRPGKNASYTMADSSPSKEAQDRRSKRQQTGRKSCKATGAPSEEPAASSSHAKTPPVTPGPDSAQETFADFCDLFGRLEVYPCFKPFGTGERLTPADINLRVHKKLTNKELIVKLSNDDPGWIYVLESPLTSAKGHLKIGQTENSIENRSKQWKKCGLETTRVREQDENSFCLSGLVERLVHTELHQERRTHECKVCRKEDKPTAHREWFEIEKETAFKHIDSWRCWVKDHQPFNELGDLNPYWRWEVDQLTRNISSVDWNEWTKPGFIRRFRYRCHQLKVTYANIPTMAIILRKLGLCMMMICVLSTIYRFGGAMMALTAGLSWPLYCYLLYTVVEKEEGGRKKRKRT
jgi:hypothetical protein